MQRSEGENVKCAHESFVMSSWQWWAWRMTMWLGFPCDYFDFFCCCCCLQRLLVSILLIHLLLVPPPPLLPSSPQLPCHGSHKRLLGKCQSQQSSPPFSHPQKMTPIVPCIHIKRWMNAIATLKVHTSRIEFWLKPAAAASNRRTSVT